MKMTVEVFPVILACEGYHKNCFVTGDDEHPYYGIAIYNNADIAAALDLKDIALGVEIFNEYARVNTKMNFIFCSGGWKSEFLKLEDLILMFRPIKDLPNVVLPKEFLEILNENT